jgi:hypothetical protein
MACCRARLGDREQALEALAGALALGYRELERLAEDEQLVALREDARFKQLLGLPEVAAMSRDDGWRADLRFFAREVKRRGYAPFRRSPVERFDAAVDEVYQAVPQLSDAQLMARLAELLRTLGDGHAYIDAVEEHHDLLRALPLQLYLFEEGLYVTAVAPGRERLLGAHVLEFDGQPAGHAVAVVDRLIGRDNEQGPKGIAPWWLGRTVLLHALGVARDPGAITLGVRLADSSVAEVPVEAQPTGRWLLRSRPCPPGWRFLPESSPAPLPLYLRNCGAHYWFEHQPELGLTYFQLNSIGDDPDEPLSGFVERLFSSLADTKSDRLVVDLRWNGGGNTFLIRPLLHQLLRCDRINRPGGLFVVIGRATYSAAQNLATLIGDHTAALFVGEPTGSSPNFVGETAPFRLPYSRLEVNVSDLYWQTSWPMDYRSWIAPDIYAPPTFASFVANQDPAIEAILACREHLPGW